MEEGDAEVALARENVRSFEVAPPGGAPCREEQGLAAWMQAGLLAFFILTRTLHPLIIESSMEKLPNGKNGYPFEAVTLPLMECVFTSFAAQLLVLNSGGLRLWRETWRLKPMLVFSVIGFFFAIGDYLELKAMGGLSGTAYQVVIQSKLIVTAVMLWIIKGQRQSSLQWILLVLLMLSLVCYAIMKDLLLKQRAMEAGKIVEDGEITVFGVFMGVLKVIVSCFAAVLSDRYMKDFKSEPIAMQLVQFKCTWFVTLLILVYSEGTALEKGLFHDWSAGAVVVFGSFTVKGWTTMYLLAILDSMLKNIGEALSVLLIYFVVVWHPGWHNEHENETFISLLMVFLSVVAYLVAKNVVGKAQKYDMEHQPAQSPA